MMDELFEKEIQKQSVFVDSNKISPHYIPSELPYRETELKNIIQILAPALSGKKPGNIFLYGKTGLGKTAISRQVVEKLLEYAKKYNSKIDSTYTNCHIHNTQYRVLINTLNKKGFKDLTGYASSHLYEKLLSYVDSDGKTLIIILDEIDKVKDINELIYLLTRSNDELEKGHISLIGISNNVMFKEKLDPRSKSTLCEKEMVFAPYNAKQIQEILNQRVTMGFKENAVNKSAINLIAALAASENGDIRYSLNLLLKGGELADNANNDKVTDEHINQARKIVEEDIVLSLIDTLPEYQQLVLFTIAKLAELGENKNLFGETIDTWISGEVYKHYLELSKQFGKETRSARWFREYLKDLEMTGLITTTMSGAGQRGTTQLIKLAFPADKILNVMKKQYDL